DGGGAPVETCVRIARVARPAPQAVARAVTHPVVALVHTERRVPVGVLLVGAVLVEHEGADGRGLRCTRVHDERDAGDDDDGGHPVPPVVVAGALRRTYGGATPPRARGLAPPPRLAATTPLPSAPRVRRERPWWPKCPVN